MGRQPDRRLVAHHHSTQPPPAHAGRGFFYAQIKEGPALDTANYVSEILSTAPALTDEQKAYLAGLFGGEKCLTARL